MSDTPSTTSAVAGESAGATDELKRGATNRIHRLHVILRTLWVTTGIIVALVFAPWWNFHMPAGNIQIAAPGGGWTTVAVKAASASLVGRDAGGTLIVGLLAGVAVATILAANKRWWILGLLALMFVAPWGPFAPPAAPPESVAQPLSSGASLTTVAWGLQALRLVYWVHLCLIAVCVVQTFLVARAEKAVTAAETGTSGSMVASIIDKYLVSALTRVGLTEAQSTTKERSSK